MLRRLVRLAERAARCAAPSAQSSRAAHGQRRPLGAEPLEVRRLLAADPLPGFEGATIAVVVDESNRLCLTSQGVSNDALRIGFDSGDSSFMLVELASGSLATDIEGTVASGPGTLRVPRTAFGSGPVVVDLGRGNDELRLDFASGAFSVQYVGGELDESTGDRLIVSGGQFARGVFDFSTEGAPHAGAIMLEQADASSVTIAFTGLEPIDVSGSAIAQIVFNLPGTGDLPRLADDGAPGDGRSRLFSNATPETFETTVFGNPSGGVTLNLGDDDGAVTLASLPDLTSSLTINGQEGLDGVLIAGTVALQNLTITGAAGNVINSPGASLNVSGIARFDAGPGDVLLGAAGSDIGTFNQLSVVADETTIFAAGGVALAELRVREARLTVAETLANAAGAVIDVAELAQFVAPGGVALGDQADDNVRIGVLGIDPTGTVALQLDGSVVLSQITAAALVVEAVGSVSDAAGAVINVAGPATLAATESLAIDGDFNAAALDLAGASVSVVEQSDVVLSAATSAGLLEVASATGALTVAGPVSGETVRLTATAGNLLLGAPVTASGLASLQATVGAIATTAGGGTVTANELALRARDGIGPDAALATQATRLAFENSGSGLVQLANSGAVTLGSVDGLVATLAVEGGSLTARSGLTIAHDVTVGRSFTWTAEDSPEPGDNLLVAPGVTLTAVNAGSDLTFVAGDDFAFPLGAVVTASGAVIVQVDAPLGDVDEPDAGAMLTFQGQVTATEVLLTGGDDNDVFVISPNATIALNVDGGAPTQATVVTPPGDTLILSVPLGASVTNSPPLPNGSATFDNGLQNVDYENIERIVFVAPDDLGPNDSLLDATFLGSPPFVSFDGLSIDSPFDRDFFEYRAHYTGTLLVALNYERLVGDLQVEIQDPRGNVIATAQTPDDDELLLLPVVQGETYFVVVSGVEGAVANYGLELENFPAPTPTLVDLLATSDSGVSNSDNLTNDTTPSFQLQVDLLTLLDLNRDFVVGPNDGDAVLQTGEEIPVLTAEQAQAGVSYGAAVEVLLINAELGTVTRGFADPLSAAQPLLFRFTVADPLADGVYLVSARVRMFDNQRDADGNPAPASGPAALSAPLTLTIDATAPAAPTLALDATSDTGTPLDPTTYADLITALTVPRFVGAAEPGSVVRLFADDAADGVIAQPSVFSLTQAAPSGGPGSGDGAWAAAVPRHLNDPAQLAVADGLRENSATAEDLAGNVSEPATLNVFLDTQGPQVASVGVAGSAFDLWAPKPSDGPTPPVLGLRIEFADFPERLAEINPGDPQFLYEAIAPNGAFPESFLLVGDRSGPIAIESVALVSNVLVGGEPAVTAVVVNFFAPLPDDRYTLTIFDSVTDRAGNALDGESNASAPLPTQFLASGDGINGGDFVGRFTVDTRAELGVWGGGYVQIDANGNLRFDPQGLDNDDHDLAFRFGLTADNVFAGNFVRDAEAVANGFDKLAVYGSLGTGSARTWRWLVDFDGDGVPEAGFTDANINGIPVAGNFDGNLANGDEVGVFDGTRWWIDANHDFLVGDETPIVAQYRGFPLVGDFDGDGADDFATYQDDQFFVDLDRDGTADVVFQVGVGGSGTAGGFAGFPGVRERPAAADMDGDGIDDFALWAPDGLGRGAAQLASWYVFLSADDPATDEVRESVLTRVVEGQLGFRPTPLGPDQFAEFGDRFAVPLLGNFDPPPAPSASTAVATSATASAPRTSQPTVGATTVAAATLPATTVAKASATTASTTASPPRAAALTSTPPSVSASGTLASSQQAASTTAPSVSNASSATASESRAATASGSSAQAPPVAAAVIRSDSPSTSVVTRASATTPPPQTTPRSSRARRIVTTLAPIASAPAAPAAPTLETTVAAQPVDLAVAAIAAPPLAAAVEPFVHASVAPLTAAVAEPGATAVDAALATVASPLGPSLAEAAQNIVGEASLAKHAPPLQAAAAVAAVDAAFVQWGAETPPASRAPEPSPTPPAPAVTASSGTAGQSSNAARPVNKRLRAASWGK